MSLVQLVLTHGDAFVTLLLAVLGIVKLTAWGRANAEALALIVDVIEQKDSTEIKRAVAAQQTGLSEVAQDVIADAVQMADAKKTPLTTAMRVCREVLRGFFAVRG